MSLKKRFPGCGAINLKTGTKRKRSKLNGGTGGENTTSGPRAKVPHLTHDPSLLSSPLALALTSAPGSYPSPGPLLTPSQMELLEGDRDQGDQDHGSSPENDGPDGGDKKRKKARTTFTGKQIYDLERQFEIKKYLSSSERSEMARLLNVTEVQVMLIRTIN